MYLIILIFDEYDGYLKLKKKKKTYKKLHQILLNKCVCAWMSKDSWQLDE